MNITINDDLTGNIITEDGLLECILPSYNPETLQPFGSRNEAQSFAQTIGSNPNYFSKKLTDEEKAAATHDRAVIDVRQKRDAILSDDVDTMNPMRWKSLTQEAQALWTQYRLDLLNVPEQAGFPLTIVWPIKP